MVPTHLASRRSDPPCVRHTPRERLAEDSCRLRPLAAHRRSQHDPIRREFVRRSIPIHFVTARQVPDSPKRIVEIEGVRTVSLEDLIAMKLRSGTANLLRAIDLADVIGLIRANQLKTSFASRLPKDLRDGFRRIVKAIADEPDRR